MATNNSVNITASGIVSYDGTSAFSAVTTTQYNLLVGAASNGITSVAPSATSGVPIISQGVSANPAYGTCLVAGGGTGAVSLTGVLTGNGTNAVTASAVTQNGVLVGGASNAVASTAAGTNGQLFIAATGSSPAFATLNVTGNASITTGANSLTINSGSTYAGTGTDWMEDFEGAALCGWVATGTGAGSGVTLTYIAAASHPGAWSLSTGTTTTGGTTIYNGGFLLGGGAVTCTWIFYLPALSDGTDRFKIRIGLGDTTNNAGYTNGAWLEYIDNANNGNWVYNTVKASSVTTANSATAVATGWQVVQVVVNAAGTSVQFNAGATVAALASLGDPITTNIPITTLTSSAMIVKSAGTTAKTLSVDYMGLNIALTTTR